jgi:hypothetical protein
MEILNILKPRNKIESTINEIERSYKILALEG